MNESILHDSNALCAVEEYYQALGLTALIPKSIPQSIRMLSVSRGDEILLSDARYVRALAKIRGIRRRSSADAVEEARQRLAFYQALLLLNQRGVACYFCNRVGMKKDGFAYAESARARMEHGKSFPELIKAVEKNAEDFKEILGSRYSLDYVEALSELPQVVEKGGKYAHQDHRSSLVNVVGGLRVTPNQPESYSKTLHVYGRCGAFGYAVEDAETAPAFLQQYLNEASEGTGIRVVNHGLWGGDDACVFHNFIVDSQDFSEGDVVLFYMKHLPEVEIRLLEKLGVVYFDITDEWHALPEARWCFYDKPGHMGADGYRNVANIIGKKLVDSGFGVSEALGFPEQVAGDEHYHAYLNRSSERDFESELGEYIDLVRNGAPSPGSSDRVGAIVMNCNPFTFGHLHLVEYASSQVDYLYIFVVEEDKSFFRFDDRFEMVQQGVAHLQNVRVFPSGQFMISALTFPEYFMKDYVKERNFDVSSDLELFCTRIAPALSISIRFAGEEPTDPVTAHYNEEMSKFLPEHDIEFWEIPRLPAPNGQPLSATKVRELLKRGDVQELKAYVPATTLEVLLEKYQPEMIADSDLVSKGV